MNRVSKHMNQVPVSWFRTGGTGRLVRDQLRCAHSDLKSTKSGQNSKKIFVNLTLMIDILSISRTRLERIRVLELPRMVLSSQKEAPKLNDVQIFLKILKFA